MISLRSFVFIVVAICFGISCTVTSTAALNYNYDVVEKFVTDGNIESEVQNNGYDRKHGGHVLYCHMSLC